MRAPFPLQWPDGWQRTAEAARRRATFQQGLAAAAYRELIRKHHPDAGGDHALAAELNAALSEAERELSNGANNYGPDRSGGR